MQYRVDVRLPHGEWQYASTCRDAAEALRHMNYARQRSQQFVIRATPMTRVMPDVLYYDDVETTSA